jgi:hypothetical protein
VVRRGDEELEQQEGPPERVVGVEVGDHHRVEVAGGDAAPAEVGEGGGRRLDEHAAVEDEAVPVAPGGEEVAGAEEGGGRHER